MLGMIFLPTLAMAATPDFQWVLARQSVNSDPVPNQMYWMTRVAPAAPRGGGSAAAAGGAAAGGRAGGGGRRSSAPQVVMTIQAGWLAACVEAESQSVSA